MEKLSVIIGPSITVALITYILTVNVAKAVASQKNLNVNATQEFVALAFESVLSSVFNGTLPSGSFSRTALLMLLDVESPLHNIVTGLFVVCVCLFMTSLLTLLPMATLAAIIFMALKSMFNIRPAFILWNVSKIEWAQWMVAFLATSLLGVTWGIVASIIFSIVLLLKSSAYPSTAVLGVLPGTDVFLSLKLFEQAEELSGIKVFRFDAPLSFANREHFEVSLLKMEYQNVNVAEKINAVIVDCSSVSTVDTSALKLVKRVADEFKERGVMLLFANWRGMDATGRRVMEHLKFDDVVEREHFFYFIEDAIKYAKRQKATIKEKGAAKSESQKEIKADSNATTGDQVVVEMQSNPSLKQSETEVKV
jgi:SulP family sulfate permease